MKLQLRLLFLSTCFIIVGSPLLSQQTDSSRIPNTFYIEAMAGINFVAYLNEPNNGTTDTDNTYTKCVFPLDDFNSRAYRPPVAKIAFNYKLNKHLAIYSGLKYSYFVANMDYFYFRSNHSLAMPKSEGTEYIIRSKVNNLQNFLGIKCNLNKLYFSITADLNSMIIRERKIGYHYNSMGDGTEGITDFEEEKWGVTNFCGGLSLNLGHDFPIGKKKGAIKLELQCDYLRKNINIPYSPSVQLDIINSGICLGYRF